MAAPAGPADCIADDPPTVDPESTRGYWGRYPVAFPT